MGRERAGHGAAGGPLLGASLNVLLLDARCHGGSDDDELTSMPAFANDIAIGLEWLRRRSEVDGSRVVLVGTRWEPVRPSWLPAATKT